jgi:hypothetical protein
MDSFPAPTPHVNPTALAHAVGQVVAGPPVVVNGRPVKPTKTYVAEQLVGLHLSNLSHLMAGRRTGEDTLPRIVDGLGVPVGLLACWCDLPGGRCRNAPELAARGAA